MSVERSAILRRLPPRFRKVVDAGAIEKEFTDLLIFETDDGNVVGSKDLAKALRKYGEPSQKLVVVGHDFTQEVRLLIDESGGIIFSERNFGWTDERWNAIKQH